MPHRKLVYWTIASDTFNTAMPNAIIPKQFSNIFSKFHLANNAEINADGYYKMHCLFDILNCNFKSTIALMKP